ncbi:MAG: transcription elongation factor GreA [Flavipsychrobacter sp.]|nr:transcription elongation factor GreA [Flavipsychrobacter sp.]
MSDLNYLTKETLAQMTEELNKLKTVGRAEIARQIAEAREKGDLKENAEYDAAKEAQGLHEARISQLQTALMSSRVIDAKNIDLSKVSILSRVTVTHLGNKKTFVYQIVSEQEADPKQGKINVTSPIGKALIGKEIGDIVDVVAPSTTFKMKIENISI